MNHSYTVEVGTTYLLNTRTVKNEIQYHFHTSPPHLVGECVLAISEVLSETSQLNLVSGTLQIVHIASGDIVYESNLIGINGGSHAQLKLKSMFVRTAQALVAYDRCAREV